MMSTEQPRVDEKFKAHLCDFLPGDEMFIWGKCAVGLNSTYKFSFVWKRKENGTFSLRNNMRDAKGENRLRTRRRLKIR